MQDLADNSADVSGYLRGRLWLRAVQMFQVGCDAGLSDSFADVSGWLRRRLTNTRQA